MAALTITAANVIPGAGKVIKSDIAGETITQGMAIYKKASDGKMYKCDANASAEAANASGISVSSALVNQPIQYQNAGKLAFGAILTVGVWYVAGATVAGDINPSTDLASGWYSTLLFVAVTTSEAEFHLKASGVAL